MTDDQVENLSTPYVKDVFANLSSIGAQSRSQTHTHTVELVERGAIYFVLFT